MDSCWVLSLKTRSNMLAVVHMSSMLLYLKYTCPKFGENHCRRELTRKDTCIRNRNKFRLCKTVARNSFV